jgi:thiamine-phosphate diphosphorylase/hydroxyethylthiazole kinase
VDVIKGNESEIKTIFGSGDGHESQRGVDSSSTLSYDEKVELVRALAERKHNMVVMTGKVDIVSDGHHVISIDNGHEYLGAVTGTGCTLGTTISAMIAACPDHKGRLAAVCAGILLFDIAAERAAQKETVQGPGSFVPAFLDALYQLRTATAQGDLGWLAAAKVGVTIIQPHM